MTALRGQAMLRASPSSAKFGSEIRLVNSELVYIVRRNVGTVGRPILACAVCNFSPTGHILSAPPGPDKGLCNIHAQWLGQNALLSASALDGMRTDWLAGQR